MSGRVWAPAGSRERAREVRVANEVSENREPKATAIALPCFIGIVCSEYMSIALVLYNSDMQEQPQVAPTSPQPATATSGPVIEWQASEYVTREKTTAWYVGLATAAVVLLAVAIFLIQDWTFAILIVVMAVTIVIFAHRPARNMNYRLSYEGLSVNDKFFNFHEYRAFGVVKEGGLYSIMVIPRKRFAPGLNVYFPPEYGEKIVDLFGSVLPMEDLKRDFVDRISEKLHF